jgi:hypothetical protein
VRLYQDLPPTPLWLEGQTRIEREGLKGHLIEGEHEQVQVDRQPVHNGHLTSECRECSARRNLCRAVCPHDGRRVCLPRLVLEPQVIASHCGRQRHQWRSRRPHRQGRGDPPGEVHEDRPLAPVVCRVVHYRLKASISYN